MKKLDMLRGVMTENELDGVLIYNECNIRYITDFAFSDGFVFVTLNSAHIFTDFRYYEMALSAVEADFCVYRDSGRNEIVRRIISDEKIKRIGIESDFISHSAYLSLLKSYSGVEFVGIDEAFVNLRLVKSDDEARLMEEAQKITDAAYAEVIKNLKPDMTEIEVAAEIEYSMRRLGADGPAFDTIAVSGPSSALPHGTPGNIKLRPGFLTMDFGAKYKGYCADMTRTVVIGRADPQMKHLYNTVLKAQRAALDNLKAGVDLAVADSYARDIIDSYDEYKGTFGHSLGHGVGLEVHESPSLGPRGQGRVLLCGEVVTVEPGIYIFSKYGCRIEDMVRICNDGVYNFTHSPKDLIEIL